jgi:tetratricopeptide (TPR) repeat protein/transcriptional regulator with XRE-family HTH domain
MTRFGDLVRRHRIAADLTQEQLAQLTGLSVRSIGDLERGVTGDPRRSTRRLLEQVLKLPGPTAERADDSGERKPSAQIVPRQLPAAVRDFVGRPAELATLTRLLDEAGNAVGVVVISTIGGVAGVGKTALALNWAHQIADRFPDGQLYVNLRGYDARPAVAASDALAGLLRGLGVPGQEIPPSTDERAALYRTKLAGRRILIVLDNALEADQVRLLLPGTPTCAVVVTSRDSMPGLVARDGARRLDLDPLTDSEAVELLRALIGIRVDSDPDAAASLAALCSRLPLALRVAAELTAMRSASPLAELVAELADRQRQLDLLDAVQDSSTAVRAVFSWSYLSLSAAAARAFRLIALHPGTEIDLYAAAAMIDLTVAMTTHLLDRLLAASLVQSTSPGRYLIHDLLRTYALEQATATDSDEQRRAALSRLFDHYLYVASAAMDILFPAEHQRRPEVVIPAGYAAPALATSQAAKAWLDTERAGLVAVVQCAAETGGSARHAVALGATLHRYLDAGGYYADAATIHGFAYGAAQQLGDRPAQASALISLGRTDIWQSLYADAVDRLGQALALSIQIGDLHCQIRARHNLGLADGQQGRYSEATEHYRQALGLSRRVGDQSREWRALHNLALIAARQGHYQQAIDHRQEALTLTRRLGDRNGEAHQLTGLGDVHIRRGQPEQAIDALAQALALCRQIGSRRAEAHALCDMARARLQLGEHALATSQSRQALALFREIGDLSGLADSTNTLGEVLYATGYRGHARAEHEAALRAALKTADKYEQARAHLGLVRADEADGDQARVREHLEAALTLYADIGALQADEIRARLATLADQGVSGHGG